ncbi:MAG: hypothetical protein CSA66_03675 [Proteobacteria bacterium]|nr:MAG: hypothetical protein CSA66_03675 [Pseudomonadota bacterium]
MLEHLDATLAEQTLRAGMIDLDFSLVFMLALFLVFALLLSKLVVKPLMDAQEQRFARMDGARSDASAAELKTAETRLAYEKQVTAARQSAVDVREQLRAEAQSQAKAMLAEVRDETEAKVEAGHRALTAAAEATRAEMKTHAVQLAAELTDKLVAGGKA